MKRRAQKVLFDTQGSGWGVKVCMQIGAVPSAGLLLMKPGPLPGRSLTTQQEMPSRGVSQTLQGESLALIHV